MTSYEYAVMGLKFIQFFWCFEFKTSEPHEQSHNSYFELCENLKVCSDHIPRDKFTIQPSSAQQPRKE